MQNTELNQDCVFVISFDNVKFLVEKRLLCNKILDVPLDSDTKIKSYVKKEEPLYFGIKQFETMLNGDYTLDDTLTIGSTTDDSKQHLFVNPTDIKCFGQLAHDAVANPDTPKKVCVIPNIQINSVNFTKIFTFQEHIHANPTESSADRENWLYESCMANFEDPNIPIIIHYCRFMADANRIDARLLLSTIVHTKGQQHMQEFMRTHTPDDIRKYFLIKHDNFTRRERMAAYAKLGFSYEEDPSDYVDMRNYAIEQWKKHGFSLDDPIDFSALNSYRENWNATHPRNIHIPPLDEEATFTEFEKKYPELVKAHKDTVAKFAVDDPQPTTNTAEGDAEENAEEADVVGSDND